MTYDIDLYRAVALARIPEDGLFRMYIKRLCGGEPSGLSLEAGNGSHARMYLKWLLMALYETHGDLTRRPRIELSLDFGEGALVPLPDVAASVLQDDLGYIAIDAVRPRCHFNLSVLRANQVATDPDLRAAYYQIASPERVAAVCRAEWCLPLHALFALGGRPDIEAMADVACLDVAEVAAAMRLYRRAGVIHWREDTGVFEINYDVLRLLDKETLPW